MKTDVLLEADKLIHGDRAKAYGDDPRPLYELVAKLWSAILGIEIPYRKVILCMALLKLAREVLSPKRDNRVDLPGYIGVLDKTYCESSKKHVSSPRRRKR